MPQRLRVFGIWIARVLGIGVLGAAIVIGVRWLSTPNPNHDELRESSLEVEWNNTISRLGIEPTYPPEEDLAVGDIFAVVLKDAEPDSQYTNSLVKPRSPYLKRSVKLAHVDVRKELAAAYSMLPTFSDPGSTRAVASRAPDSGGSAAAAHDVAGLFMHAMPRQELPRAAFPSLKIQSTNSAAGGLSSAALGLLNYGASSQSVEELQILDVTTYGLPSVRAYEALSTYCNDEKTGSDCLDHTARKYLEPIVGPRIRTQYLDKDGNYQFAVTVGIVMVNRVYLTRSILHVRRSGSAQGGGARVEAPLPGVKDEKAVQGSQTTAPSASRDAAADAHDTDTTKKRLDEVETQLAKALQGGAIAYAAASGNEILLKEVFTRPVAIGYRSVTYVPTTLNKSN